MTPPDRPKKRRLRSSSLLWTFTGAFLVVLVVGILLQALLVLEVVRPAARNWVQAQGQSMAQSAAKAMSEHLEANPDANPEELREVLTRFTRGSGPVVLVYRDREGEVVSDRPLGRLRGRWARMLDPSRSPAVSPRRPFDRGPDSSSARGQEWNLAPRPDSSFERRLDPDRAARIEARMPRVLTRVEVEASSGPAGELIAFAPPGRPLTWPAGFPQPGFLFLPVAALLAGAAGFLLFRMLTRRLRSLEAQAGRVAAGDLSARIPDPGGDEIGRLAQSLNRMTANLAEARERLEGAEAQRRRFLADVTHELSTPLTSIHGYAETMLDPKVPVSIEEREAYLRHILGEAARMDLLVRDLLDLARLEPGSAELELVELDWADLCRQSIRRFEPRFRDAGLTLQWIDARSPIRVRADGRRLEEVIDNLLTNELRYVPRGGVVRVSVSPTERPARAETAPTGTAGSTTGAPMAWAQLVVLDDGPGFSPTDLPHIFERFYRADSSRTSGGTGLGLAIVREIVRRHGGEVHAENLVSGGARLVVTLPAIGDGPEP